MNIHILLPLLFISLLTMGNSCVTEDTNSSNLKPANAHDLQITNDLKVTPTTISYTYYVSEKTKDGPKFCDGENMDSAGYMASLTKKITVFVAGTLPRDLTNQDKIKNTLHLAADAELFNEAYTRIANTTFENHNYTVVMHPAGGWAGSSIFFCKWKPFVKKNMKQFPEVTKIRWEPLN